MKKEFKNLTTTRESLSKLERIKQLEEVVITLKKEFVGLDEIIDQIRQCITPWYVTPEIINRPVVISLWGMTGTGKSSVVKRLTELLQLDKTTVTFDCGQECGNRSTDISDSISSALGTDESSRQSNKVEDLILVLDEFQHARTLDESGYEEIKPQLRPIWSIIDNGMVQLNEWNRHAGTFKGYVEDLAGFVADTGDIALHKGRVIDKESIYKLLVEYGQLYFECHPKLADALECAGLEQPDVSYGPETISSSYQTVEKDKEEKNHIKLLSQHFCQGVVRKLNNIKSGLGNSLLKEFSECTTLSEGIAVLNKMTAPLFTPKVLDCSKSLVFILGNLDEAFQVEGDINPDIDADVFFDITSKVTVSQIKTALRRRFRAEQIARFGNNLIKYPTLRSTHFKEIIQKEVSRLTNDMKKTTGYEVEVKGGVLDLLYSEGVYPVQGVRPVLTTIGAMLTPLFSDIIISFSNNDGKVVVDLRQSLDSDPTLFRKKTVDITITQGGKTIEKVIPLQLGALRSPSSKKTRYINAIHEIGHAIASSYFTGILPSSICSISSVGGGFCDVYNPSAEGEIDCRLDLINDIRISLAGYVAEFIVFSDSRAGAESTLLGSGSDLSSAWGRLNEAAYKLGLFSPMPYTNLEVEGGVGKQYPSGTGDNTKSTVGSYFLATGGKLTDNIESIWRKALNDVRTLLGENIELLLRSGVVLGELGKIDSKEFKELIDKYGKSLTSSQMEKRREELSGDIYLQTILGKIKSL